MALDYLDSCGHMGAGSSAIDPNFKWTGSSGAQYENAGSGAIVRRVGDSCLKIVAGGGASKTLTYVTTRTAGAACYVPFNFGGSSIVLGFGSGGTQMAWIFIENDNTISLYVGGVGRVWNSGSSYVLTTDVYHYFELSCALGGGTPITYSCVIQIDGNNISGTQAGNTGINASGLIVDAAKMNQVFLGAPASTQFYFQDIYCLNSNTTDLNGNTTTLTTFIGDVEIDAIFPDADAGPNDFTQGAGGPGSNYQFVNLDPPTGDNSYLYDDNVNDSENYNMTPISGFVGVIRAAQLCIYAKKDAEGSRAFEALLNATAVKNLYGTNQYLYDYYDYFLFPLDTDLGTAWTEANFNAASFGAEITI